MGVTADGTQSSRHPSIRQHRRSTMTPVTVRNPRRRAIAFIVIGLVVGLISLPYFLSQPTDGGGSLLVVWLWLGLPWMLGWAFAGLFSARAMVVAGPEGLRHNGLLEKHRFRWDEVSSVQMVSTKHSLNLIPTGTTYEVRLHLTNGRTRELPAPHAGRLGGREDFLRSARALADAVAIGKAQAAWLGTTTTSR
jgi:hypothetical protein